MKLVHWYLTALTVIVLPMLLDGCGFATQSAPIPSPVVLVDLPAITPERASSVVQIGRLGMGRPSAMLYSPLNSRLAIGSTLGAVIYDSKSLEEVTSFTSGEPISAMALSPNQSIMAMGLTNGDIVIWNAANQTVQKTLTGYSGAVISMLFVSDNLLVALSSDGLLRQWDIVGNSATQLDQPLSLPCCLTMTPDGAHFAYMNGGAIVFRSLADNRTVKTIISGDDAVADLKFVPASNLTIVKTARSTQAFSSVSGQLVRMVDSYVDTGPNGRLAVSPDQNTLAVSDGAKILLFDLHSFQLTATLSEDRDNITRLAFTTDNNSLASISLDGNVRLWNIAAATSQPLPGYSSGFVSLAISPDGNSVAGVSHFQSVDLWRLGDLQLSKSLSSQAGLVRKVRFSPDGAFVSAAAGNGIRVWRTSDGQLARTLGGIEDSSSAIGYSTDGRYLASGETNGRIEIWNIETGQPVASLDTDGKSVTDLEYSPDGKLLASTSGSATIDLWDVASWKIRQTLTGHSDGVQSIAFSPVGDMLASASLDNTVRLWNTSTGQATNILVGHTDAVLSVAFSPDGRILASGSRDQTIRIWEVASGKVLRTLNGHRGFVNEVVFSPRGNLLASASFDGVIALWGVP